MNATTQKSIYEDWSLDSLYRELGFRVACREDEVNAGRTTQRADRRIAVLKNIIAKRHEFYRHDMSSPQGL